MFVTDINPENFTHDFERYSQDIEIDYYNNYYRIHNQFLRPTSICVDVQQFETDMKSYHHLFRQWGYNRPHRPRYGISLFNLDGDIRGDRDFGCTPLDRQPEGYHYKENDFNTPTEVFLNSKSLRVFDPISDYMIRSNILLWHKHANFQPHLDTRPKPENNLRLWGTNDPSGYVFNYLGQECVNVEPGRIYLVDTTRWHWAEAIKDWNYTFFIALKNSAIHHIEEFLI